MRVGELPYDAQLAILVCLPADMHATAAAVCKAFKAHLHSPEFKVQRRATGYEEHFYVAAGGYGGDSCAVPYCAVLTASGWHKLPDLLAHVSFTHAIGVSESAATVIGDTFYLLGGETSGEPGSGSDSVWSIQPHLHNNTTLSWRFEPNMPAALCYHVAGAHDGTIVVAGGREDPIAQGWYGVTGDTSASTYLFDARNAVWTEGAPMPKPRQGAVGTVIDGVLHVVGGFHSDWEEGDEDGRVYDGSVIYSYDVAANAWSEQTPTGDVVEWNTTHDVITAVAKDGKMYVLSNETVFGPGHDYKTTMHFHIFNPAMFTFTRGPDLPANQATAYGGLSIGLFHGEVNAVGGFRDQSCFVLDETHNRWHSVPPAADAEHHVCPMTSVATVYK